MVPPTPVADTGALPIAGAHPWAAEAATVLDPGLRGVIRVLGGPGTGKTSLLVDTAIARIGAGAHPESVLLLTGSGRLGARARGALTAALLSSRGDAPCRAAVREPLVRSVHAYAFAVLRLAAQRQGDPPPRLIAGAEQDGIIRELLAGDVEDGSHAWPETLRAALTTDGFTTELRDLLSRCAERGLDPLDLQRIGRLNGRPEWVAAGRFARQYEQVMLLRSAVGMAAPQATVPALGSAELVGAALEAFTVDPGLLAAEHARIGILLVDDAQNLDPQAARLVHVLASGVDAAMLAGDPNQAVFGFRGADAAALLDIDGPMVELATSHRCAAAIARAVTGVARLLPGRTPARNISGPDDPDAPDGSVAAVLTASEHAEAAVVADTLRRAHLVDGVPWSQMTVIVRSVPRAGAGLPRALTAAGVPVAAPAMDAPLPDNAVVRALLTALAANADGLTATHAHDLLTGPIGRVDPVTLRQLRRSLRRLDSTVPTREFGDLLVSALRGGLPSGLAASHARPLRRVQAVLQGAARGAADPRSALWEVWQRSGLPRRLLSAAERGGQAGPRATQNLNAVTALFDVTDQFVSRTPGASIPGLLDHVDGLRLPVRAAEPVQTPEAVTILSPHQALGREWDLVVIAGLQEGLWPNAIPRGGVLGTQQLLDVLDDVSGEVSARAPVVADERRLLIAAMGRARRRLVVTATDSGDDGDSADLALPSPFFFDIARHATTEGAAPVLPTPVGTPQVLSVPAVVGRLRAVVCAPDGVAEEDRAYAAGQLARLAAAGVPGADPADWHGMTTVSTIEPLWSGAGHTVTMSPSTLQTLQDCPLRWLLERHGGRNAGELRSTAGSLIHALIAQPGKSPAQLEAELDAVWPQLPFESDWFSRNELERHRAMLATFMTWRADTRHELTEVGTEVDVDGVLPADDATDGGPGPAVRVRGRIDRLERDAEGRPVVVDVKTGKTPVSKDDAQRHAQLALYQLAIAQGLASADGAPGGGRLVYVGRAAAGGATERSQDALTPDAADQWRRQVGQAAAATAGPQFVARVNAGCGHCPVRPSCPAHHPSQEPS
jgi:superfamily I DNA/RNA helicase/RecB family exonuclease